MKVIALAFVSTAAATAPVCFVATPSGRLHVSPSTRASRAGSTSDLRMKLWDFGLNREAITGPSQVENNWEAQQEILKRRNNKAEMAKYKAKVAKSRKDGDAQYKMWKWQNTYDGGDPLTEWKKMKDAGKLDKVYEDDENPDGGIPIPMASFGVGGSFGLGGKWDEGARFDLRLPYADQGYVDENEAPMKKLQSLFGFGKKAAKEDVSSAAGKKGSTKAVATKKAAPSSRSKVSSKAKAPQEQEPKKKPKNIFGW